MICWQNFIIEFTLFFPHMAQVKATTKYVLLWQIAQATLSSMYIDDSNGIRDVQKPTNDSTNDLAPPVLQ